MRNKREKIFLSFYTLGNFGDDFFIKLIGENVPEADFYLIVHPKHSIYGLPSNIKVMKMHSFIVYSLNKLLSMLEKRGLHNSGLVKYLQKAVDFIINKKERRFDTFVEIGGSIFMQNGGKEEEKSFTVPPEVIRDYSIVCKNKKVFPHRFVIGANFGPYISENYRLGIEKVLSRKTAVCLRDYSSYCLFKHLDNVQYAPDVVFTYEPVIEEKSDIKQKRVLISLIDPDSETTRKISNYEYYQLINDSIVSLIDRGFEIDLVSFCDREGDVEAIKKIVSKFSDYSVIKTHHYKGNIDKIIELFKHTDFVIASRFHSMVLGFIYQKPVFPIAYNCKTVNYLVDLNFTGKYAHENNIADLTSEDVLYNYDNKIICDITQHKKYAKNQFFSLKQFLREKRPPSCGGENL